MNTLFRRSMALALVCALSGCAIVSPAAEAGRAGGRDVERGRAGEWPRASRRPGGRASAPPELQSLVAEALAGSPDLAIASERVQQAEAQVRVAGASLFPVLNLRAEERRAAAPNGPVAQGPRRSPTAPADVGLTASYELDLWGRNRAGVRSAASSAAAARFDRDTAQVTLVSGVATSYFDVLALRARLVIARDNLAIAQQVAGPGVRRPRTAPPRPSIDCALVFNAIYGPDGKDNTVLDVPFGWDATADVTKLRVGFLRSAFSDNPTGLPGLSASVQLATRRNNEEALRVIRGLGVEVVPFDLPEVAIEAIDFIRYAETAAAFDDLTRSGQLGDVEHGPEQSPRPAEIRPARFMPAVGTSGEPVSPARHGTSGRTRCPDSISSSEPTCCSPIVPVIPSSACPADSSRDAPRASS